ncbi:MAG TPA: N-acetylmuramoyl-L-alanine amidase [Deinococcales bacterium]|nr:N-acetylmuramoyl-L-alanine amidase [Deinococcales bacterium]
MFDRRLGWVLVFLLAGLCAAAQLRALGDPRVAAHADEGFTRVVLDLPGAAVNYSLAVSPPKALVVTLPGVSSTSRSGAVDAPDLAAWSLAPAASGAKLTLKATGTLAAGKGYRAFTLPSGGGQPARLVVDLGRGLSASGGTQPPAKPAAPVVKPAAQPAVKAHPVSSRTLVVVLDPGHGGLDPGCTSPLYGVTEKNVTLDIALRTRDLLTARGVKVVMTRSGDTPPSQHNGIFNVQADLSSRSDMASIDRNVFVSIHVNASPDRIGSASGIETYVFGEPLEPEALAQADRENGGGAVGKAVTAQARNIARSLMGDQLAQENLKYSRQLAQKVQAAAVGSTGAYDRGVRQAPYWVIRFSRIPAILVETGFANHPSEGPRLATAAYRQKVAQGIASGILNFLHVS